MEGKSPMSSQATPQLEYLWNRTKDLSETGFTRAEEDQFLQTGARTAMSTARRGMVASGGQGAGAVMSAVNAAEINSGQDMIFKDADLSRMMLSNLGSFAPIFQNILQDNVNRSRYEFDTELAGYQSLMNAATQNFGNFLSKQESMMTNLATQGMSSGGQGMTGGEQTASAPSSTAVAAPLVPQQASAPFYQTLQGTGFQYPSIPVSAQPSQAWDDPMGVISGGYKF